MAFTPAEIDDKLLKYEARTTLLQLLVAELVAMLSNEKKEALLAGLKGLVAPLRQTDIAPVSINAETVQRHLVEFADSIHAMVSAPMLTREHDWQAQYASPPFQAE